MLERKKLFLILLIISVGTVFLSWRYLSFNPFKIEKIRGRAKTSLTTEEEASLLLKKIDNLLEESKGGKRILEGETNKIFYSGIYPEADKISKEEKAGAEKKIADRRAKSEKKINEEKVDHSLDKQAERLGRQGRKKIGQGRIKNKIREKPLKKAGIPSGGRTIVSLGSSSGFGGKHISAQNKDGSGKQAAQIAASSLRTNNFYYAPNFIPASANQAPASLEDNKPVEKDVVQEEDEKEKPTPTPYNVDFFGHVNAEEGAWVLACNSEGRVCGRALVKKNGLYGPLHVYMSDGLALKHKQGMSLGEPIIFRINGKKAIPLGPDEAICQGDDLKQVDLEIESES